MRFRKTKTNPKNNMVVPVFSFLKLLIFLFIWVVGFLTKSFKSFLCVCCLLSFFFLPWQRIGLWNRLYQNRLLNCCVPWLSWYMNVLIEMREEANKNGLHAFFSLPLHFPFISGIRVKDTIVSIKLIMTKWYVECNWISVWDDPTIGFGVHSLPNGSSAFDHATLFYFAINYDHRCNIRKGKTHSMHAKKIETFQYSGMWMGCAFECRLWF